jgi:hypothetical protein
MAEKKLLSRKMTYDRCSAYSKMALTNKEVQQMQHCNTYALEGRHYED